jgi:hydroxylamine reductase
MGKGCTVRGVCGKDETTATMQDLLIYAMKGIAFYGAKAREAGVKDDEVDRFMQEGLFTCITNVDFDPERMKAWVLKADKMKKKIKALFEEAYKKKTGSAFNGKVPGAAKWEAPDNVAAMVEQGKPVGILSDPSVDEDVRSLRELILYGLKGMAAYADHAAVLGERDETVDAFLHKGMAALEDNTLSADQLIALIMELGQVNLKCMEILDKANTGHYGHPVPTNVSLGEKKGPAILVSGHDLKDLKMLLEQTEGKGVNIYTHGEMLPANAYPELKKHKHLAGHYGTAWQNQQKEFAEFPGSVLMTTNCIQKPQDSYLPNIFTTGLVAFPGVKHIGAKPDGGKDFAEVISRAVKLGGFKEDKTGKEITVGFARNTILSVAGKVVEAVKAGQIKRFFLIGGCDGARPGRNYYTEFSQKVPKDCVIITLACGKFRFNREEFGDIGGIPRLLDCGQCNDAYSAIVVASALASAFNCTVNDLPLSFILSWYEQKAVCILLTLLSLGIKNMRLGPSLPAFVSPNVLKVLVEKFNIKPLTTVDADLADAMAGK